MSPGRVPELFVPSPQDVLDPRKAWCWLVVQLGHYETLFSKTAGLAETTKHNPTKYLSIPIDLSMEIFILFWVCFPCGWSDESFTGGMFEVDVVTSFHSSMCFSVRITKQGNLQNFANTLLLAVSIFH